jgi:hypothetical protein
VRNGHEFTKTLKANAKKPCPAIGDGLDYRADGCGLVCAVCRSGLYFFCWASCGFPVDLGGGLLPRDHLYLARFPRLCVFVAAAQLPLQWRSRWFTS